MLQVHRSHPSSGAAGAARGRRRRTSRLAPRRHRPATALGRGPPAPALAPAGRLVLAAVAWRARVRAGAGGRRAPASPAPPPEHGGAHAAGRRADRRSLPPAGRALRGRKPGARVRHLARRRRARQRAGNGGVRRLGGRLAPRHRPAMPTASARATRSCRPWARRWEPRWPAATRSAPRASGCTSAPGWATPTSTRPPCSRPRAHGRAAAVRGPAGLDPRRRGPGPARAGPPRRSAAFRSVTSGRRGGGCVPARSPAPRPSRVARGSPAPGPSAAVCPSPPTSPTGWCSRGPAHPGPPPARPVAGERRVAITVAGLGSTSGSAAIDDLRTSDLGYDDGRVVRFSYAGGRTPGFRPGPARSRRRPATRRATPRATRSPPPLAWPTWSSRWPPPTRRPRWTCTPTRSAGS